MMLKAEAGLSPVTYVGAADALQQQSGDLCLPVKLTLGHPQLLLCLSVTKQKPHFHFYNNITTLEK